MLSQSPENQPEHVIDMPINQALLISRLVHNPVFINSLNKKHHDYVENSISASIFSPLISFGSSIALGNIFGEIASENSNQLVWQILAKSIMNAFPFGVLDFFTSYAKNKYTKSQVDTLTAKALNEIIANLAKEDVTKILEEIKTQLEQGEVQLTLEARKEIYQQLKISNQALRKNFSYYLIVGSAIFSALNGLVLGVLADYPGAIKYPLTFLLRTAVAILHPFIAKLGFGMEISLPMKIANMFFGFGGITLAEAFLPQSLSAYTSSAIYGVVGGMGAAIPGLAVQIYRFFSSPKRNQEEHERMPLVSESIRPDAYQS
jgi:hypothetical protein